MPPEYKSYYANAPIEDLGLLPKVYKHLCSLGVRTVGDLFNVPESAIAPYLAELVERIERLKIGHAPPA